MNHKAKQYQLENQKKTQEKLTARVALLEGRGMKPEELAKDAYVRKLKADIRKAGARLRYIDASEKLNDHKIKVKQEKAEAEKQAREAAADQPTKKKTAKADKPKKEKKAKEKPMVAEAQD